MAHGIRIAIVFAAVAGLVAGCGGGGGGSQEKVVATAGDVRVTLADFHEAYNKITPTYRPDISTLEGKRAFAEDLVNKGILMAESQRLGGITDPNVMQAIEGQRDQAMLQILYREEVQDKVEVLGADVKDLWEKRKTNVRVSHILVDDVAEANRIKNEIASGRISFEDAAAKWSMDLSTRRKGGSAGEVLWNRILPMYQALAFELEPGVISDPLESKIGVHLVRTDERIPQEEKTLEEMRAVLRNEARRQLEGHRLREFTSSLEEKAGLEWNDEGVRVFQDLIREFADADVDTIPPERQYVPQPTVAQRGILVASFAGRDWTIGNCVDATAQLPPANRVQSVIPKAALKQLIRSTQIQNELLLAEGRSRNLGDRTEINDRITRMKEQVAIELVHARFIQAADVPEVEVRAIYDSTLAADEEALRIPEQIDMMVLVHNEESVVREALAMIKAGGDEADIIQRFSLDPRTKNRGGVTGPIARGTYAPQLEDIAFAAEPGSGWLEPIVTESGTGTVKVLERIPSRIATFEDMQTVLTNQMAQARGEAAFEEWLQEQRTSRGVEIHDDVLELIGESVS